MNNQWFVIHTLSGQEQKVKENIEKRMKAEEMTEYIKEVLVPMEKVAEVRGGKKTVTTRKLHPGYVYIEMALLDENRRILDRPWYFIRETPGIIGFVGGDRPVPVTADEIAVIKEQIADSEDTDVAYHAREALERMREELDWRPAGSGDSSTASVRVTRVSPLPSTPTT